MIAIMWQFDVKTGRETEFEQLYGADGEWTAMNRHTRSYLGTSFLHDQNRSSRYIVIEYWSEMIVHEQHRTLVVVTHNDRLAATADRILTLEHGVAFADFGQAKGQLLADRRIGEFAGRDLAHHFQARQVRSLLRGYGGVSSIVPVHVRTPATEDSPAIFRPSVHQRQHLHSKPRTTP